VRTTIEGHGRTQAESTPWWPTPPHPGDDAPDVVVVLLDDLGFAQLGCYGSDIETPNIDRLAAGGCASPTSTSRRCARPRAPRCSPGRNHHEVGMRAISNFSSGYPHMRGHISDHAATVAEVLRDEGYATFAVGKWHLCPMEEASAAGPFDQWPCQRGFDRYYGFLEGETDQFHPELVHDNHHVDPPASGRGRLPPLRGPGGPGHRHGARLGVGAPRPAVLHSTSPSGPPTRPTRRRRSTWRSTGAASTRGGTWPGSGGSPASSSWASSRPGTELAPRNPGVEAWDDLPENHRRLAARLQEAFAAFLDHTDAQIGRLLDDLDASGASTTPSFVLLSDNGASQEGGPFGVMHEMKFFNFLIETPTRPSSASTTSAARTATPTTRGVGRRRATRRSSWYKQNTHEGGVHVPLIVHWPAGGRRRRPARPVPPRERRGAHHLRAPRGHAARHYRGASSCRSPARRWPTPLPTPDAPTRKEVQYFEMMGHRGICVDGWKAVTRHQSGTSFDDDTWELYHLEVDRSECHDLAAEHPEKLAELIDRWWERPRRTACCRSTTAPSSCSAPGSATGRPHRPDRHYTYHPPVTPLPAQVAPALGGRSWDLWATVDRPTGAGGVLYASGTENSGLSLFVQDDRLVFDYNCFGDHHVVESERPVPEGRARSACGSGGWSAGRRPRWSSTANRRVRSTCPSPCSSCRASARAWASTTARR
jgi:arylsulfatase A-like enzyme